MAKSPEEIKKFLFTELTNKEDLKAWCIFFLGYYPIDVIVSRYATTTPLDMLWELYQAIMTTYKPRSSLWCAARGLQKTATMAVFEILGLLHAKRQIFHLAAIEKQASRAKHWANKFSTREHLAPYFQGTNNVSVLHCKHPDVEDPLVYEIAPAQLTRVQGPRSNILVIDEISVLKGERIQAYKEARYIPVPTMDGKPAIRAGITSRRGAYTVTEQEIEEKEQTGLQVKYWTGLEGVKVCPESRHGGGSAIVYSDIYENKALTEGQFNLLMDVEKDRYDKVEVKKNCFKCPLVSVCRSDLAKPRKTYKFMKTVESFIEDFVGDEYDMFLSQQMSLKPSSEGLAFKRYSSKTHRISYRKMWEIYTGEDPNKDITEAELIDRFRKDYITCFCGVDWGSLGADPCVATYFFITPDETVFVLRSYSVSEDPQIFLDHIWNHFHHIYGPAKYYADTSQPATIRMMKTNPAWEFIISEDDKKDRTIIEGIRQIRKLIAPPVGKPKFYMSEGDSCETLHDEFTKYHHSTDSAGNIIGDEFEDTFNHGIDSLRYGLSKVVSRSQGSVSFADSPDLGTMGLIDRQDDPGKIYRDEKQIKNLDIADLARRAGVNFVDNRDILNLPKKSNNDDNSGRDPGVDF